MARFVTPRPGRLLVLQRLITWTALLLIFGVATLVGQIRGVQKGYRARRLRASVEKRRGTVALVARHLALRVDLLPPDVCAELAEVDDLAPPIPIEEALPRIEAACGLPLLRVFEAIDPEPIDADSLSTTWQAQLVGGRRVAIRVERKEAGRRLAADVAALRLLAIAGEWFTLSHPGRMDSVIHDLKQFVVNVLDVRSIYRSQQELRRRIRRAKLENKIDAARVFTDLSGADVIVSEFRSGIRVSEAISAIEGGESEALWELARQKVDPSAVGKRLLRMAWWQIFETPLFTLAPRAETLVIEQGRRIAFLRAGVCGNVSARVIDGWRLTLHHFSRGEVSRATVALIDTIDPMPYIDLARFTQDLEEKLADQELAMRDSEGPWWARSTMGIWLALADTAREHHFSLSPDLVALMQASLNVELVVGRLTGGVNTLKAFRRYERDARRRKARGVAHRILDLEAGELQRAPWIAAADALEQFRGLRSAVDSATRRQPLLFTASTNLGAYIATQLLGLAGILSALALVAAGAVYVSARASGDPAPDLDRLVNPVTVALAVVFMFTTVRRLLFRLQAREERS